MSDDRSDVAGLPAELRAAAESQLRAAAGQSSHEVEGLAHELEVYRVELEIQNQELRASSAELEQSLQRYYLLFDRSPIAYLVLTRGGMITDLNSEAAALLQLDRTIACKTSLLAHVTQESRRPLTQYLSRIFAGENAPRCEVTMRRPEPQSRIVELCGALTATGHGDAPTCMMACVDVSELRHANAYLEVARRDAERADALKGEFLSVMSHEIRTPLASLIGYVDLILRSDPETVHADKLNIVRQAGDHLRAIVNELLDFSKIEANELKLHIGAFETAELFDYVTQLFAIEAEGNGVRLSLVVGEAVPEWALGDRERIQQCLINLVSNALAFTPSGGDVTVRVEHRYGNCVISVIDTGVGIPETARETIFRPFRQVDQGDRRTHRGTGLGLTITRRLVELMGGSIHVRSRLGHGSTFTVQVPLEPTTPPRARAPEQDERPAAPDYTGERVLVVDDDAVMRQLMCFLLDEIGIAHDVAVNGAVALDMLSAQRYSLVLLDMQMPVMDGLATIKRLRADPSLDGLPVIALTAKTLGHEVDLWLAAGCNLHLSKPVDLDHLIDAMNDLIIPRRT